MIAGYRVLHELGRGGMATVYRAVQESLGREVALKVMTPELARDPAYAERFLREGRAVARLRHRNIVTIHDLGLTESGSPYMAMEYVPGGSAAARIGAIDARTALLCVRDIAAALDHAHRNGVIHRDVKPENILCHDDGSYLLSDFGVARLSEATSSLTAEGATLGTPHYMSPEQWRGGELDGRSDLYSLGVVLYQLLTGTAPYSGTDGWAIGMQHMMAEIPRLPPDKRIFQPLIDALLAKNPSDRPASGADVVSQIDALLPRLPPLPPPKVAVAGVTTPMPVAALRADNGPATSSARGRANLPPPLPPDITRVREVERSSRTGLYWGLGLTALVLVIAIGWSLLWAVRTVMHSAEAADAPTTTTGPADSSNGNTSTGDDSAANGSSDVAAGATAASTSDSSDKQAPVSDPVVAAQLKGLGIDYTIDKDGDFRIVQDIPGGKRTQQSWVRSKVEDVGGLHVREVMSVGYRSEGADLPSDVAQALLRDTHDRKLGGWTRQGGTGVFVVTIPADASAEQLGDALQAVRETADEVEARLTNGKDEF